MVNSICTTWLAQHVKAAAPASSSAGRVTAVLEFVGAPQVAGARVILCGTSASAGPDHRGVWLLVLRAARRMAGEHGGFTLVCGAGDDSAGGCPGQVARLVGALQLRWVADGRRGATFTYHG
jgi:hypothetical protein